MKSGSWTHATELAPIRASASAARAFARLHLREHGLEALVDDVELVVSELATNAIKHACTPFTVRLRGDGLCLLLTVHDSSREVASVRPPGSSSTGGRGLAIVDQLSHDWGVDHTDEVEKCVWASFRTP
jgi:anti-sigma regulatory factor (Ser/Thr protein kinase)